MGIDNYSLFCKQLNIAIEKYQNLSIKDICGRKSLKGILDIYNDYNELAGSFSIEIGYKEGFPYRFPILYEVGGDIPCEDDWHKYSDKSCCITVKPDEILKCYSGINILSFIEKHAKPYLANQIYRKKFGTYKNGAYAHGPEGLKQFYSGLFKTTYEVDWLEYLQIVFENKPLKIKSENLCFCGSSLKYKYCHERTFYQLRQLGFQQIFYDLSYIYS